MSLSTIVLVKNALGSAIGISNIALIEEKSHLKRDLQLDSMSSLMFLMKLEETIEGFFVDAETLRMSDLETVDSVVRYVDGQLAASNNCVH